MRTWEILEGRDRIAALAEVRRVLAPGGLPLSAHISRFASACDDIQEGMLRDGAFAAIVHRDEMSILTRPDRPESASVSAAAAGRAPS